jgi:hypothetical protein
MKAVNRRFAASGWITTANGKPVYRHYRQGRRMVTRTIPANLVSRVEKAIELRQSVEKILAMLEDCAIAS